ncbi:MAG: PKD domain-containing protein, partial [Crocinitomicaceae bacterium]|nr:PKD domain-containing protein [Crocinitomicaceae bacterium]
SVSGDHGDGDLVYCLFPGDNTTSETVTFSNSTTNATSYEWDFGDGIPVFNTGSLANFTHDYTTYGTFSVTMTATNANGCQTVANLTVVFEKFVYEP